MSDAGVLTRPGEPDAEGRPPAREIPPLREDLRRSPVPIDQFGSWRWHFISFAIFVVLPVLVAGVYYGLIAADRYAAEARFSVRSASELVAEADLTSTLLGRSGRNEAGRLPYVAANYLRSRNAARDVNAAVDLRAMFSRPQADVFMRFDPSRSDDSLWSYWRSMLSVSVDRVSGIVLVRALAFTPQDAEAIASALQASTERMIDAVAQRSRRDALRAAEKQVEAAGTRYAAALAALRDVRNQEGTVDPQTTIELAATTLLGVVKDKLALERQLEVNRRINSAAAPQQKVLADQISALEAQVLAQTEAMTSQKSVRTAAQTLSRYERQELERRFSERLLEVAQAAYEKARVEFERQHIYLAAFSPPQTPERAEYPRRLRTVASIGLAAFGLWMGMMVVIAGVRDRRNGT